MKRLYSFDNRLKGLFNKNLKLFTFIITIPVVCLFLILYSVITRHYTEQSEDFAYYAAQNLKVECDNILRQAEMQGIKLTTNEHVMAYVASNAAEHTRISVQNVLNSYMGINNFFDSITVYSFSGDNYITAISFGEIDEKTRNVLNEPMAKLNQRNVKFKPLAKNNMYPFLIRLVFPVEIDKSNGAVVVDVNVEKFSHFAQNLNDTNNYKNFVVCDGKIVFGSSLKEQFNKSFSEFVILKKGSAIFENNKHIIKKTESVYFPLEYISLVSMNTFSPVKSVLVLFLILGIIACIIIAVIVAYSITKRSISPFDLLIKTIESPEGVIEEKTNLPPELCYIIDDIKSRFMKNNGEIEKEMAARLLLLKTANVEAMQMQMKPHFLYNVLDALSWKVYSKLGEENDISSALADLSDMYRMNVRQEGYIVSLRSEIVYLEAYIKLIRIIERENINLSVDINENFMSYDIIKFTLQPLVENSIAHGKSENIIISASVVDDFFCVYVDDDGEGIAEDRINAINSELSRKGDAAMEFSGIITSDMNLDKTYEEVVAHSKNSGIALNNINTRIKTLMGDLCGLSLGKSKLGGLRVTVRLQLRNDINE